MRSDNYFMSIYQNLTKNSENTFQKNLYVQISIKFLKMVKNCHKIAIKFNQKGVNNILRNIVYYSKQIHLKNNRNRIHENASKYLKIANFK